MRHDPPGNTGIPTRHEPGQVPPRWTNRAAVFRYRPADKQLHSTMRLNETPSENLGTVAPNSGRAQAFGPGPSSEMDGVNPYPQLAASRTRWLNDAVERAARDPRVVAVLLSGSLARDGGDAWSNLDLIVVPTPVALDEVRGDVT